MQAAWALPLAALALTLPTPAIALAAVLAGIGSSTFNVVWSTALQHNVPAPMLARVASYDAVASYAAAPVGLALAGPAAATVGILPVLLVRNQLAPPHYARRARPAQHPSLPLPRLRG